MLLNLRVEQVDIAAAHGDDQIAGLPMRAQIGFRIVKRRGIMRGHALRLHGLDEHGCVDIAGVFFACGEDIRHQHLVGIGRKALALLQVQKPQHQQRILQQKCSMRSGAGVISRIKRTRRVPGVGGFRHLGTRRRL